MALPIYTQGKLDELCGVYAFVNGYIHRLMQTKATIDGTLGGDLSEDLFKWVLNSIPKSKFPQVLWEGMDVTELLNLCKKTCKVIEQELSFKHEVMQPFKPKQFRKPERFFDALIPFHCEPPATTILLALDGSPGHWVALKEFHGTKIRLLNNGNENLLDDKEFSLRQGAANRIVQEETIVVRLLSVD